MSKVKTGNRAIREVEKRIVYDRNKEPDRILKADLVSLSILLTTWGGMYSKSGYRLLRSLLKHSDVNEKEIHKTMRWISKKNYYKRLRLALWFKPHKETTELIQNHLRYSFHHTVKSV